MKTCSQCDQSYGDDKKYCLRCGISLEESMTVGNLSCIHCATQNNPDFAFCKKCGIPLKNSSVKVAVEEQAVKEPTSSPNENIATEGKSGFTDGIKEQIKKIAAEAFKKAGITSKTALHDEQKFNTAVGIAHKLLPLPMRILVKKEALRDFLKDILLQTKDVPEKELQMRDDIVSSENEKNGAIAKAVRVEEPVVRRTEPQPPLRVEQAVGEGAKVSEIDRFVKPALRKQETTANKAASSSKTSARVAKTVADEKQNSNYVKYVIIGVAIVVVIAAGFFLKTYLTKPSDQNAKGVVPKPQPAQPQKPLEVPKRVEPIPTVVEQPKEQRPTAAGESPASVNPAVKNQTAPAERSATTGKPIKKETAAKAKQQIAPQPEATKDQLPKKNEKKSFAPHSRDDL